MTVHHASNGSPYLRVIGCYVSVGFTDVVIRNGGLVGDVFNSQFRGNAAAQARQMLPSKICAMIPHIIGQKLNSRLKTMPQSIPLTKFASIAEGIVRSVAFDSLPGHVSSCNSGIADVSL
ncbi:unnamed protein product [Gongylonema pulchrum]|uniref:BPI1 domain-containing protein n=1 Tax=Gongylonema pulchrum TaxID=637853 RepID=A0A3P7RN31_9BILA|nr:unnamed protein product [Gongylonema pulchrum]